MKEKKEREKEERRKREEEKRRIYPDTKNTKNTKNVIQGPKYQNTKNVIQGSEIPKIAKCYEIINHQVLLPT